MGEKKLMCVRLDDRKYAKFETRKRDRVYAFSRVCEKVSSRFFGVRALSARIDIERTMQYIYIYEYTHRYTYTLLYVETHNNKNTCHTRAHIDYTMYGNNIVHHVLIITAMLTLQ